VLEGRGCWESKKKLREGDWKKGTEAERERAGYCLLPPCSTYSFYGSDDEVYNLW